MNKRVREVGMLTLTSNLGIAHRILLPVFGPLTIRGMFDEMHVSALPNVVLIFTRSDTHRISQRKWWWNGTSLHLNHSIVLSMWHRARHGSDHVIHVTDDFTRLTLDTIALCAMDYRFNSYYSEKVHPFIEAMGDFLKVSGDRARRPPMTQIFYRQETQTYWENIELLRKTSREVIETRRKHPETQKKDL